MKYRFTEAIKNGFRVVNRNWQLVLIQAGLMFVSLIGFLIFVGLPLAIAFIIFGMDLIELSRIDAIFKKLSNPYELIAKYSWLVVLILGSLIIYISALLALGIFVFGGSAGVIGRAIKETSESFRMKSFISEGKRLFFPLLRFTALIGLIFIALAFIVGLFGGAISAIVSLAKEKGAALALFIGTFFSLILFVIALIFILVTLAVTIYGAAILSIRGLGPVRSIKEAARYLYKNTEAFYLYTIIFGGYVVVSFIVLFFGYPLGFIPLIGPILTFGYQFVISIVQSYLGLAMISVIFSYYYFSANNSFISENSTRGTDTSAPEIHGQGEIHPEKGMNE